MPPTHPAYLIFRFNLVYAWRFSTADALKRKDPRQAEVVCMTNDSRDLSTLNGDKGLLAFRFNKKWITRHEAEVICLKIGPKHQDHTV